MNELSGRERPGVATRSRVYATGLGLALVLAVSGVVVGQDSDDEYDPQTCLTQGLNCPPELEAAAEAAALDAAGGNAELGGEIRMFTNGAGDEVLNNMFAHFSEATGVDMILTEVPGVISVLGPQMAAGNVPDLLWDSTLGHIREFANYVQPLEDVVGEGVVESTMNPAIADFITEDGHLYSIPLNTQTFSTYYHPGLYEGPQEGATWNEIVDWGAANRSDLALFCVTTADGAFSSNKEAQLIDNLLLQQHGPDVLLGLVDGSHKWNSPEVIETINSYLRIFEEDLVYGGRELALTSGDDDAPALFSEDPPNCDLQNNGPWMESFINNVRPGYEPGVDFDNFFLGSDNPDWGPDSVMIHNGGGHLFAFTLTPQTEAFIRYVASPEFQTLMASTGVWLMMNTAVDPDVYPSPIMRKIAAQVSESDGLIVSPFGGLPASLRDLYVQAVHRSIEDPSSLEGNLQDLDEAVEAYMPSGG